MNFGALAFLNPILLSALLALPILYWLLRTVPPTPRQVVFPPTRILVGIENKEKMPAKSPWWLTLLRLLAAALVIFALANPLLNPTREQALSGNGPVVLVVDNGWASAAHWQDRLEMMDRIISNAETNNKPVMVVPTAFTTNKASTKIEAPSGARTTAAGLIPQPFAPDQSAALTAINSAIQETSSDAVDANVVWLTDGILHKGGMSFAKGLSELSGQGTFSVIESGTKENAIGVHAGLGAEGKLVATVVRSSAGGSARNGTLHAFSARDERLGEAEFQLPADASAAQVTFDLPLELRNQVTRVTIAGETSAGAVALLDSRSQRQRVALLSGESLEQAQPLLGPLYYIDKALAPYSEIIKPKDANLAAGINQALEQNATVIVLADIGRLNGRLLERVQKWVERGGILVRFAGARLEKGGDTLLPAPLREGGRTLGGALSWSTPQPLAPFDDKSAFVGLDIPSDVLVNRQVLADPTQISDSTQVWASLKDGTPLVTADNRGDGRVILFHVTANSDWSSLPISGLFVDMLRRITAMGGVISPDTSSPGRGDTVAEVTSSSDVTANETILSPQQTLDGFGALQSPPPTAQPLSLGNFTMAIPTRDHPPGYYGFGAKPRALNVLSSDSKLTALPALPSNAKRQQYKSDAATPLKPWLLALAFAFILLDIIAVLILQAGGLAALLPRRTTAASTAASIVAAVALFGIATTVLLSPSSAFAQNQGQSGTNATPETDIKLAIQASEKVTFGYVLTGDLKTDDASRIGLKGLGTVLNIRTAVSPGAPVGVDITRDEVAFYPILYWPILKDAQALPDKVLAKIDAYMKQGGMIIFDTRNYGQGLPTGVAIEGSGSSALRRLLGRLDIPRLEPVPQGHVLTKSFYLLRTFPGRWDGGQLWAEASSDQQSSGDGNSRQARRADGVTSILITSNDFASAWALDNRGRPLYPTIPGGEPQREMAFRTGINIVMHALTGNYKADQVHVPALLDRFGQ